MNRSTTKSFAVRLFVLLLGAVSLSGIEPGPDHRKIEPFLLPSDEPAVVAAQRKVMGEAPRADLAVPVFVHLRSEEPDLPGKIRNLTGTASRIAPRLYVGRIPRDSARYLSNWPEVAYLESGKRVRHMLDRSGLAVSANIVQVGTPTFPPPFDTAGFHGDDVFVGIVDTGLSGAHPDFAGRIAGAFTFAPGAAEPLADTDGHGTHVTGIAAGNGSASGGLFTGMAPRARLLIGRAGIGSFFTTDVVAVMADVVEFAQIQAKPVAINLSLGSAVGPHDNSSAFESSVNALALAETPGSPRLIAVAAGNERDKDEHFQEVIPAFGQVSPSLSLNAGSGTVQIWADGGDQYTVTATMGTETVSVPSGFPGTSAGGRISVSNRVATNVPNGATFISVTFNPLANTPASIRLARTRNGGTGRADAYIDEFDGTFNLATATGTIIEPANAPAVLAVGSFNTKTHPAGSQAAQDISSFSSFGPTRDGRLKPDVAAPGSVIYSTRSLAAPILNYIGIVSGNDNYAILQGTSMAAPHVTGIAALVWQSNPSLTGAQMRERLRRTANAPTDGSTPPNTTWGFGKVNALSAVSNTVASITAPDNVPTGTGVIVSAENSSGGFATPITSYTWSAPGATVVPSNVANPTFSATAPGNYVVSLNVTAGGSSASATKTIRVNRIPSAAVEGPSSSDNVVPVSFSGTGTDGGGDGQLLTFRWILVSRPAGSSATLPTANVPNVTLIPDRGGIYEVGLRVDDGLDNSALVTRAFQAGPAPVPPASGGGGGGGGCSVARETDAPDDAYPLVTFIIIFSPLWALAARRYLQARAHLRENGPRSPSRPY